MGLVGDYDLGIGDSPEFLEELAAMAAGGCRNGDVEEFWASVVGGEVGDEKLLCMDGMVEGEAGEFDVSAEEDAAIGG